jgi:hypothetical protein
VACGEVVVQLTLPDVFGHEYQVDPAETSLTLSVLVVVGLIENVTASILLGSDALSVYATLETVKPEIAPEPSPAAFAVTVLDAVNP